MPNVIATAPNAQPGARYVPLPVYGNCAYELLKLYAARGESATWGEMCDALGYDPRGLGAVLDYVAARCQLDGVPNVATLVNLGDGTAPAVWHGNEDEWEAQRSASIDHWAVS